MRYSDFYSYNRQRLLNDYVLHPFETDGCSGALSWVWKRIFRKSPPWEDLCIQHDRVYWRGGTACMRKRADLKLYYGVKSRGHRIIAALMYVAVRVGGHPMLPFSWRWGYGWERVRYNKIELT